jgi:hypothetical protein
MGMNDDMEKLVQAEEWLGSEDSELSDAAWDHVTFVYRTATEWALRDKARQIINEFFGELIV